jgi:hypothetical protein
MHSPGKFRHRDSLRKNQGSIRRVQFGDGYSQVSGKGIHPETLTLRFSFTGKAETALEIFNFCDGTKQNHSRLSHRLAIWLYGVFRLTACKISKNRQANYDHLQPLNRRSHHEPQQ